MKTTTWQELALVTLTGMEVAAFAPWMHSISPPIAATPLARFLLLAWLFVTLTAALQRTSAALNLRQPIRRSLALLVLGAGLLAMLRLWIDPRLVQDMQAMYQQPLNGIEEAPRVIPAWFWVITFALMLWGRGLALGRERIGSLMVMRSFEGGVISLALFALSEQAARPAKPDFSTGLLLAFLITALLALATGRVSTLARLRGGHRNPFDRRWGTFITVSVLTITLIGVGAALIISGRTDFIAAAVETLSVLLGAVLLAPFLLLLALLQPAFDSLLQAAPAGEATPMPTLAAPQLPDLSSLQQTEAWVPPNVRPLFLGLGGLVLLGIVIWMMRTMADRLERPRSPEGFLDPLETDDPAGGLRSRLVSLAQRLRGLDSLTPGQRRRAAARIRQIYADFITLCARHELTRPVATTPLEFIPLTADLLPTAQPEVRAITEAYLRVRYGELPETRQEVRAVEAAWQRVKERMMQ